MTAHHGSPARVDAAMSCHHDRTHLVIINIIIQVNGWTFASLEQNDKKDELKDNLNNTHELKLSFKSRLSDKLKWPEFEKFLICLYTTQLLLTDTSKWF